MLPTAWISRGAIDLAERGRIPDALIRVGIRRLLQERAAQLRGDPESRLRAHRGFLASLRDAPIALVPDTANTQHYEVPAAFFETVLGPRQKYSACWFAPGRSDLARAEEAMLALTCERAGLEDGMRVLDLGCGWGSLTLWIAEHYPRCEVSAVSNSKSQAEWIRGRAAALGSDRVRVVTADMNEFGTDARFDRVISVEMFEHMRNWERLLRRIAGWLAPEGRLFVHHFAHREIAYPYEDDGERDWMARHFFSGGLMPSDGMLLEFPEDLTVEERWRVDGRHYQQTCEAWLANLDGARDAVRAVLGATCDDAGEAERRVGRWRLFFMACAELFGYRGGDEWWVVHARLALRGGR